MDKEPQILLTEAFRNNSAIGLHIDLQKCFGSSSEPHFRKAETLASSLRDRGHHNIWITYNNYNSGPILPDKYKPVCVHPYSNKPRTKQSAPEEAFETVTPKDPDIIFSKLDDNVFYNRRFRHYLEAKDPKALIISGMDWDACVESSVNGALRWRFGIQNKIRIFVVHDATDFQRSERTKSYEALHDYYNSRYKKGRCRSYRDADKLGVIRKDNVLHVTSLNNIRKCLTLAANPSQSSLSRPYMA